MTEANELHVVIGASGGTGSALCVSWLHEENEFVGLTAAVMLMFPRWLK